MFTMHIHLAMLGEKLEPVVNGVRGIPDIDRICIIYSKRFNEQANTVQETFAAMGYSCSIYPVSGFDFQEIVDIIYQIYGDFSSKDAEFSMNITGGTNLMAAAACSTAFFTGASIYYVMFDKANPDQPIKERLILVPTPKIPDISQLSDRSKEILKFINDAPTGEVTNTDIADEFKIHKVIAGREVKRLQEDGLVEVTKSFEKESGLDRRYNTIRLTRDGKRFASWLI